MKLTQIRNATNRLEYADKTFLIDPWLMPKHQFSFVDVPGRPYHVPDEMKEHLPMPFYDLPMPMEEILAGVDYYLVTHIHPDHIDMSMDGTVGAPLDKNVPVICQNEADAAIFQKSGFHDVTVLSETGMLFGPAKLTKVPALHGTVNPCGDAMGVMFESAAEKIFYLAGDTVWYPAVADTLKRWQPEIVALNCCAAETVENGRLIMDAEDVHCVAKTMPNARLYLTHLDNVAHAALTRHTLKGRLADRNVTNYDMPKDGQSVMY
ncbi:hypothetical protein SELR_pSRC100800 (plasmid) [Selenomonas ruminantium subsp. lactilytica TAM6421]|uniref:L-ascorbate metabolism protein UlaG, beta-lactamase superfamily n=2 Tax=Selenomonas ruminantium TaxID=971 RepID=A0A1M6W7E5_SELRU|nr:MBL fold metallo-hydrolase [Selenomonas ruminantium]BAL84887.1 hypothetical protein SELR_pSRC100800 [Selenomonas ruminantium subsp. lactilytica TAM6421]SHK89558.1 L-ascorbate metabolism protein UlaG, beta-lactamase superfamily [Selenomonas ruminantium]